MWKIVAIMLLTVTVMLAARLVYKAPTVQMHFGDSGIEHMADAAAFETPRFIYAGIRG